MKKIFIIIAVIVLMSALTIVSYADLPSYNATNSATTLPFQSINSLRLLVDCALAQSNLSVLSAGGTPARVIAIYSILDPDVPTNDENRYYALVVPFNSNVTISNVNRNATGATFSISATSYQYSFVYGSGTSGGWLYLRQNTYLSQSVKTLLYYRSSTNGTEYNFTRSLTADPYLDTGTSTIIDSTCQSWIDTANLKEYGENAFVSASTYNDYVANHTYTNAQYISNGSTQYNAGKISGYGTQQQYNQYISQYPTGYQAGYAQGLASSSGGSVTITHEDVSLDVADILGAYTESINDFWSSMLPDTIDVLGISLYAVCAALIIIAVTIFIIKKVT